MNGIQTAKGWIGAITQLGLALVALAIVATILVGPDRLWAFGNVVANLMALIQALGEGGLAGLIALGVILWLFSKQATS
ncbi:MAG: hypothetical protein ACREVS_03760 [Burkholderiales bacterium]